MWNRFVNPYLLGLVPSFDSPVDSANALEGKLWSGLLSGNKEPPSSLSLLSTNFEDVALLSPNSMGFLRSYAPSSIQPLDTHIPLSFETASGSSYKVLFSHGRSYGLGYRIVILLVSFVLGLLCAASLWFGLLFDSVGGAKILRYWIYSLLLVHHTGISSMMAEPETEVISWYGLKGGEHCLRYATREYTAKLTGGPSVDTVGQGDMMKLCRDTPTVIHGQTLFTDFCQDLGFGRGVWGFWVVDFEESDCETKWGDFVDLVRYLTTFILRANQPPGMYISEWGSRRTFPSSSFSFLRVKSQLENLPTGSSWQIMCATTPADIDGHHFGGPDRCHSSRQIILIWAPLQPAWGTYGVWDLTDGSCGVNLSNMQRDD
ncbi:hypothetical protein CVT25_011832 [Psilocybe cyanescens]|uniref:Uncharacterized protein n=1 Tax=Psilocybe cyanescens TaxID=93625 RepID=A0A409WJ45_PSICY|nr:hypothetical protein CVT25_011832 [Psilocybe cyanescens]